jgi:glutaredoxin 3
MSTVESFVNDKINSNKVMVFSGSYCPYCTKAKNVLSKYTINSIEVIELDQGNTGFDMDDVMVYLEKITGGDTVRLFVSKKNSQFKKFFEIVFLTYRYQEYLLIRNLLVVATIPNVCIKMAN